MNITRLVGISHYIWMSWGSNATFPLIHFQKGEFLDLLKQKKKNLRVVNGNNN